MFATLKNNLEGRCRDAEGQRTFAYTFSEQNLISASRLGGSLAAAYFFLPSALLDGISNARLAFKAPHQGRKPHSRPD